MPPLPPNLTRAGVLRTTPSWNQRTSSRRDNHTRFLAGGRFPSKPSSDTNWVNPSLPPGASRLAQPIGSTGHRYPRPIPTQRWLLIDQLPLYSRESVEPASLSIAYVRTAFAVGYPLDNDPGFVRVYDYNETTAKFDQLGEDISPDGADKSFGTSVALTDNAEIVLAGMPLATHGDNFNAGEFYSFTLTGETWNEAQQWYSDSIEQAAGYSMAITKKTDTNKWYMVLGEPGIYATVDTEKPRVSVWSIALADTKTVTATKLSNDADDALFDTTRTSKFGISVGISNLEGVAVKSFIVAGAPGLDTPKARVVGSDDDGYTDWVELDTKAVAGGSFGTSVSMSGDGQLMVIGDPDSDRVRAYYYDADSATFKLLGGVLSPLVEGTRFGACVAIDRDAVVSSLYGTTIAIGEPGYSTPLLPGAGRVLVMEYTAAGWTQVLNSVTGTTENEGFGERVALFPGGSYFVATGSPAIGRTAVYGTEPLTD